MHRRDKFRAEAILVDRLMAKVAATARSSMLWNHTLDEVLGDARGVTGVRAASTRRRRARSELAVHGCFIAIGHTPNTEHLRGPARHEGRLHQITRAAREGDATATSVPGVFAAGDVQDHVYRQAITSAGTGCMAALDAQRFLENLDVDVPRRRAERVSVASRALAYRRTCAVHRKGLPTSGNCAMRWRARPINANGASANGARRLASPNAKPASFAMRWARSRR